MAVNSDFNKMLSVCGNDGGSVEKLLFSVYCNKIRENCFIYI